MDTTLTTGSALDRMPSQRGTFQGGVRRALRRLERAIVTGSDHPCWTAPELTLRVDARQSSASGTGSKVAS